VGPALDGTGAAYVAYAPDPVAPGAVEVVGSFAELAVERGVPRLVLLAGRGEPEAEEAERAVAASGADLTVLRSTWFAQNFSEDYMREHVLAGVVALPGGDTPEPFADAEDIAEVALAPLTDDRHSGELYELTGPATHLHRSGRGDLAGNRPRDPLPSRSLSRSTPPRWPRTASGQR
jgi:hypothetical protein